MRDPFEILSELRQWVLRAEEDLLNASNTLKLGRRCPVQTVCFHAQQCAEKYLKSLLVLEDVRFPHTHDIERLIALLPVKSRPPLDLHWQRRLGRYAVVTRYPGDYLPIALAEAREAVKVARCVRAWCRRLLPRAALRTEAREAE
jgi:HEPN domain-containing protein